MNASDTALVRAEKIDALLPQTQCTRCGYQGCKPYADAIARGEADINQCPPGGAAGIVKLAALLSTLPKPLNPANGVEKPLERAVIDESLCIGCTLCIQACPVDVIIGAPKLMHTVIADQCTGCELCVAPCPVDCIAMVPVTPARLWTQADADMARARYSERNARLRLREEAKHARHAQRAQAPDADEKKRAIIAAALERARAQREAAAPRNTESLSASAQAQVDAANRRRDKS